MGVIGSMIKLLIGGSPCTYWSIAQKNNRETEPSGMGWELFKNYLIAKEKFKPDFFLYENNKSATQAIKDQIKKELKDLKDLKDLCVAPERAARRFVLSVLIKLRASITRMLLSLEDLFPRDPKSSLVV